MKAAGLVGLLTLASRVLGMLRDVVSARQFGTGWEWDAFVYAFMLPNFFRRLVGEGALSSAFIPVYNETLTKEGEERASYFANAIMTLWALGISAFIVIIEVCIHFLLQSDLLSPRIALSFGLLRVLFPYLLFVSLYALAMGILNSHKHFLSPAIAPILLNIFWIGGIIWVCYAKSTAVLQLYWLAGILLFAGSLQLLIQLPALRRAGFRYKPNFDFAQTRVKRVLKLLTPAVLGFAVMQINILVDMSLAFWIGPGAGSSLWYGTRLMQLPLGVFAIAMGTALLPTLSKQVANKEHQEAKESLSFALRSVFLVILPCTVGLMVLATPIVDFLFARGEFDAQSTARTSTVLFCYSIGLFAYSAQKLLTAGFHAVQDTRTPVKIAIVALVSNVALNLWLMNPLGEAGLALATSISGTIQFVLLAFVYHKKITDFPFKQVSRAFIKILIATLAMGAVSYYLFQGMQAWVGKATVLLDAINLGVAMAGSAVCYLVFCFALRIQEMRGAIQMVLKRGRK